MFGWDKRGFRFYSSFQKEWVNVFIVSYFVSARFVTLNYSLYTKMMMRTEFDFNSNLYDVFKHLFS